MDYRRPDPGVASYAIAVDRINASALCLATSAGLFHSSDGGANWFLPSGTPMSIQRVVTEPGAFGTAYGAAPEGVYKTTNGGADWSLFANSPQGVQSFFAPGGGILYTASYIWFY